MFSYSSQRLLPSILIASSTHTEQRPHLPQELSYAACISLPKTHGTNSDMVLNVLIAGAGIGGLTVAITLRRQGHHVEVGSSGELCVCHAYVPPLSALQVFEQSRLASETGAAIHIVPNANSVIQKIGTDVAESGANLLEKVREYTVEFPHVRANPQRQGF